MNHFKGPMVGALLLGAILVSPVPSHAQSNGAIDYRADLDIGVVERSLDDGLNWQTVRQLNHPAFYWLIWDEQHPQAVCVYYAETAPVGGLNRVECSWDAGDNWYVGPTLTRVDFEQMPWFANQLMLEADDTLTLTAYNRVFSLEPLPGGELSIQPVLTQPSPPSCDPVLSPSQVCANLALEGVPAVWYDPEQPGQGITLVGRQGLFWGYYTAYDEQGDAHWYLFEWVAGFQPISVLPTFPPVALREFTGPPLGTPWDPDLFQGINFSTFAVIRLVPPRQLRFSHRLNGQTVTLDMRPFE